jgi:hypothetical protein
MKMLIKSNKGSNCIPPLRNHRYLWTGPYVAPFFSRTFYPELSRFRENNIYREGISQFPDR